MTKAEIERVALLALAADGGRRRRKRDGLARPLPTETALETHLAALTEKDLQQLYRLAEIGRGEAPSQAAAKASTMRRAAILRALDGRMHFAEHLAGGLVLEGCEADSLEASA